MKRHDRIMHIIADTREQTPLVFPSKFEFGGEDWRVFVSSRALATGDYSLEGYEDKLTIERKGSLDELAGNLTHDRPRFTAELERMRSFTTAMLLVTEPYQNLIDRQYRANLEVDVFHAMLDAVQERYRVPIRWANTPLHGGLYVLLCFRRFAREESRNGTWKTLQID